MAPKEAEVKFGVPIAYSDDEEQSYKQHPRPDKVQSRTEKQVIDLLKRMSPEWQTRLFLTLTLKPHLPD